MDILFILSLHLLQRGCPPPDSVLLISFLVVIPQDALCKLVHKCLWWGPDRAFLFSSTLYCCPFQRPPLPSLPMKALPSTQTLFSDQTITQLPLGAQWSCRGCRVLDAPQGDIVPPGLHPLEPSSSSQISHPAPDTLMSKTKYHPI